MSEQVTNLRQSVAKVKVAGIVSSKDLTIENVQGQNIIKGSVNVEVDETNVIRFSVYAGEKTKNGAENPAYKGLLTVKDEFKTIADNGREEADKIYVNGDLNPFTGLNGRETVGQRASFFNRAKKLDTFEPEATFDVEMFIKTMVPEVDKEGEETGRVLVKGWVVTFNGIEPITLIADKDLADGVQSTFEVGQTARFFGDIINNRVEIKTEIPMALGKPRIETKVEYKNELRITGASDPYPDEQEGETPAKYDKGAIDLAITERQARLEAKERESAKTPAPSNSRPTASGTGRQLNW